MFGSKPTQRESVQCLLRLSVEMYKASVNYHWNNYGRVSYEVYEMPHGRFVYLIFCFATVHVGIAPKVRDADAVLNEGLRTLLGLCFQPEFRETWDTPDDLYRAGEIAAASLDEFLARWSTYLEIRSGGNRNAATDFLCSVLHYAETGREEVVSDAATLHRLRAMATWIERFVEASRSSKSLPAHFEA